ncbi:MAG TPA: chemotaxis protein CheW [Limnobacter sp.]|nr:chemotaxis protein CheW [Limnobacter sp.]
MQALTQGYGAFRVGSMNLVVPLLAIREVVPLLQVHALPCTPTWVHGGLDLRGVSVPVIELSVLLGKPELCQRASGDCVIVVAMNGKMLGLLANQMHNLFFADDIQVHRASTFDGERTLFAGSIKSPENGALMSLLDVERLLVWPQMPTVEDPEPHRENSEMHNEVFSEERHVLMLMRCGGLRIAIDPRHVETTLTRLSLQPAEMQGGCYVGNVSNRGETMPAIDLAMYLGIGNTHAKSCQQAFVMRMQHGPVALLIEQVLDMVDISPTDLLALPSMHLQKPQALQHVWQHPSNNHRHLVLHTDGLMQDQELLSLARVLSNANQAVHPNDKTADLATKLNTEQLVVFALQEEFCTPMAQVLEVLPFDQAICMFARENPLLGVITHKSQAIAVLDLAQWMGLPRQDLVHQEASILLVAAGGAVLGFAVNALLSIQKATWSPAVPLLGEEKLKQYSRPGAQGTCKQMAELGEQGNTRMLEVLDLQALAQAYLNLEHPAIQPETLVHLA